MNSDGQTIFNGVTPTPKPINNTTQPTPTPQPAPAPVSTSQSPATVPVFNSSDIAKSKAATKTNYFVNLKRSTAFDRLSEKLDQKMTAMEVEAKKRAEAEALAKANKSEYKNPDDRFVKKETNIYVPSFVKEHLTNGIAEPNSDARPTEPQKVAVATPAPTITPLTSPISEPNPTTAVAPSPQPSNPKKPKDTRILYGILAGIISVIAIAIIVWQLIPQDIIVQKKTSVATPVEETTLLDEVTEQRLAILGTFESEGADAGITEYNKYISKITDSETLALVYSWESLDLYRLYRGEYLDLIKQCIAKAEELKPTYGTASLLYFSEHEFGDETRALEYRALVMERQASIDDSEVQE